MKSLTNLVFAVVAMVTAPVSMAATRHTGDLEMNVWGASYHLNAPPAGHVFNETNPGIGLRAYIATAREVEFFADADYIRKNSTTGTATLAGIGMQKVATKIGRSDILVGVVGGVMRYGNAWEGKTYLAPAAYPFVGVRHRDITLNVGYIPRVSFHGMGTYAAVFGYASIRF